MRRRAHWITQVKGKALSLSNRDRSRRTCLSVPGSSEKMLRKAQGLSVDMVFLDLEDAVAPPAKEAARHQVVAALNEGSWAGRVVSVRINDATTPWALDDLTTVVRGAGAILDSVMLPKCSEPAQVHWLDRSLSMLEASSGVEPGSIAIELQIEDAAGLTAIDAICAASARTVALHFGPGDFQASLGIASTALGTLDPAYPGDPLHHVLGRILVAGRAQGLQVLDGPHPAIHDLEGLRASARRVAAMGYDGKWVLHPAQIDTVNEAFTPALEQYERAERVLDAYAHATSTEGGARGAVMLDGEMVDEATRKMALVTAARGRAAGLSARAPG
jgi:citrate lyase subunit beta/citryl-CoA lyase